jgi:hypothetical protein
LISVSVRDGVLAACAAGVTAAAAGDGADARAAAAGPTARLDATAVAAAIATKRRAVRSRPPAPEGLLAFIRLAPRYRAMAPAGWVIFLGLLRRYFVYWTPYCHARLSLAQTFLSAFLAPLFGFPGAAVPAVLRQPMTQVPGQHWHEKARR